MPAKPAWFPNLPSILAALRALPKPFVDRPTVESLLGVGRRRAQQIMAPCITEQIGSNCLADRDLLITHLDRMARGEAVHYEVRRRQKVAALIDSLRQDRLRNPQLLVEAPVAIVTKKLAALPDGITIGPGRIMISFEEPQQALEKLLALAMAIGNDFEGFELATQVDANPTT